MNALTNLHRVLRPGGIFYFDEVTAHALARPSYRALFDHPEHDRFTAAQFLDELPHHGLQTLGSITRIRGDYLLGAAIIWLAAGVPDAVDLLALFILFRAFDILKPWPVSRLEEIEGGDGVMLDDIAAGILAAAVLLLLPLLF